MKASVGACGLAVGLVVGACRPQPFRAPVEPMDETSRTQDDGEVARLRTAVQRLQADNRALRSDLDALTEELAEYRKQPVQPGRPDPSIRYRVDLGDAAVRGPATARVTIVE